MGGGHTVSYLKSIKFPLLKLAEKNDIKERGRNTPQLIKLVEAATSHGKKYERKFAHQNYYSKFKWLCGCEDTIALYCFPCILFGGDANWTETGVKDLKNLMAKCMKHDKSSKKHIENLTKLAFLGKVSIVNGLSNEHHEEIWKYNEEVAKNRHIVSMIIDCFKFCGKHELSLWGLKETADSTNPGVFCGLLGLFSELDPALRKHFETSKVFKGHLKTIQCQLLECMLAVCHDQIVSEISKSQFVSFMTDDTTDVSEHAQMVVIFRYELHGKVFERFWTFINPTGEDAESVSDCLIAELKRVLGCNRKKLIAQTYDGAAAARKGKNGGVNVIVKRDYVNAHFVHCYAHQLHLIMQQATAQTMEAKLFFSNLSGIPSFFSRSPLRLAVLDEVSFHADHHCIPCLSGTHWNFQSHTVKTVIENQAHLRTCFDKLMRESKNQETRYEAGGLLRLMDDETFLHWLNFFSVLMPHVDVLFSEMQCRSIDSASLTRALDDFKSHVSLIRDKVVPMVAKKRGQEEEGAPEKEVCDTLLFQTSERLKFTQHLEAAKLLNHEKFKSYQNNFPATEFQNIVEAYPMLAQDELKTQLQVLYVRDELHSFKSAGELLSALLENELDEVYSEVVTLLRIVVTTPMSTTEAERSFSVLKRIKMFLRNRMEESGLTALVMLSVERQLVMEIEGFNERVIEKFAARNRRVQLKFK